MFWIIFSGIIVIIFIGFVLWCCCRAAAEADRNAYKIINKEKEEEE